MKKILSAVLAAAMVLSMGVMAFAAAGDKVWGSGSNGTAPDGVDVDDFTFYNEIYLVRDGSLVRVPDTNTDFTFEPGDDLYFSVVQSDGSGQYKNAVDKNWSINIKANDYVEKASFYVAVENGKYPWGDAVAAGDVGSVFVKVEIVDDLDEIDAQNVNFYMYLANNKTKKQSEKATVKYSFDNISEYYVDFDFTNDADHAAKWIVEKNKKGTAVFDFEDNVYFTVPMVSEEKVILNLSTAYDKDIDKEYNEYDADLSFYNFKGENDSFIKTGELFIPSSKDNKFIYEVVDGELVAVEAEYDSAYKVANLTSTKKGYVIETKELGYYVVADEELVVADEDVDVDNTTDAPTVDDGNKTNPPMGANDFVGAAVALAVVSVAAAGALALKK